MSEPGHPTPFLFLDDGYPESREYANNYVTLPTEPVRGWLHTLLDRCRRRPQARRCTFATRWARLVSPSTPTDPRVA